MKRDKGERRGKEGDIVKRGKEGDIVKRGKEKRRRGRINHM